MEIKYQLEPTDLEALTAFIHRGSLIGLLLPRLPWFFGFLLLVVGGAFVFDPKRPVTTGLAILVAIGVLVFVWSRRHKGIRERGKAIFAPTTLTTFPESFQASSTARSSTVAWSQVQGYGETAGHIFIMLDGLAGYVIPKRHLSAEDSQALRAELERYSRPLPARPRTGATTLTRMFILWLALFAILLIIWQFLPTRAGR
jgi:hypothetical protein